jgi:hypothetical protein
VSETQRRDDHGSGCNLLSLRCFAQPKQAFVIAGSTLALRNERSEVMTNFVVYLIGTLLVVAGLAYGASRLGVSQVWIIAGALVVIGFGLMGGIVKTRQKDPAS